MKRFWKDNISGGCVACKVAFLFALREKELNDIRFLALIMGENHLVGRLWSKKIFSEIWRILYPKVKGVALIILHFCDVFIQW